MLSLLIDRRCLRWSSSFTAVTALALGASSAQANQWLQDVRVSQIGAYQTTTTHHVWLSVPPGAECQAAVPSNPVLRFDAAAANGRSLMAVMTAALLAQRPLDIQVSGCNIVEVYLR